MNNRPLGCKAYERGDQWFCDRCGVTWDHNDNDPPECRPPVKVAVVMHSRRRGMSIIRDKEKARDAIDNLKEILKNEN